MFFLEPIGERPLLSPVGAHFTPGAALKSRVAQDLRRAGPQVLHQPGQEVPVRVTRGQVNPDAAAPRTDAGPDFQEFEPQGVDLGHGQFRALDVAAQQPKQAVGRGVEQQPELVGQEAVAAQAIGLELHFALLDAVFHLTPQDVDLVIDQLGAVP